MKFEGDGATPRGQFGVLSLYYRQDRLARPTTPLPSQPIKLTDGWCDAPTDRNYNRPVQHPYSASAERLWRNDHLYDVVGILDYNIQPRCKGRGSAIFLHIASPDCKPTEGCIAVSPLAMRTLLRLLGPNTKFVF